VPRLLRFNVEHEDRLAGISRPMDPALRRKLAARFLFMGRADDTLEGDFEVPASFRARFPDLPRVAPTGPGELLEWAPSEPRDVVRRVASKAFAHELALRLGLGPPGTPCRSVEEVAAHLPEGRWVLKRAFGHGGRGHFLGAGKTLPPNAPGWIAKSLAPGEPVLLEPWVEREKDYSVQLEVADEPRVLATLELVTTPLGAYVGNRIGTVAPTVARELESVALLVARALHEAGYRGPAGVDAYSSAGKLRPLVEINPRHTMGRIALEIARRLGVATGSWLTGTPPEGAIVTDPFPDEPGPATFFVPG